MNNPLSITTFDIDATCVGQRWVIDDFNQLVRLIAIIAMGQAEYAAEIISNLIPTAPAFTLEDIKREAIVSLTKDETKAKPRIGYPEFQRDGFVFEIISWIAARQTLGGNSYLKDPHIKSTSQGIDGLIIEIDAAGSSIEFATIFEDKCTTSPRNTFTQQVLPTFRDFHKNLRSVELVAAAVSLIKLSGVNGKNATNIAKGIMDKRKRKYRSSFILDSSFDTDFARRALFANFDALDGLQKVQRIGSGLIVGEPIRTAIDTIAKASIAYIESLEAEQIDV